MNTNWTTLLAMLTFFPDIQFSSIEHFNLFLLKITKSLVQIHNYHKSKCTDKCLFTCVPYEEFICIRCVCTAQVPGWIGALIEQQQKAVYIYWCNLYCMLPVRPPFSRAVPAVSVKTGLIVRLTVLFSLFRKCWMVCSWKVFALHYPFGGGGQVRTIFISIEYLRKKLWKGFITLSQ